MLLQVRLSLSLHLTPHRSNPPSYPTHTHTGADTYEEYGNDNDTDEGDNEGAGDDGTWAPDPHFEEPEESEYVPPEQAAPGDHPSNFGSYGAYLGCTASSFYSAGEPGTSAPPTANLHSSYADRSAPVHANQRPLHTSAHPSATPSAMRTASMPELLGQSSTCGPSGHGGSGRGTSTQQHVEITHQTHLPVYAPPAGSFFEIGEGLPCAGGVGLPTLQETRTGAPTGVVLQTAVASAGKAKTKERTKEKTPTASQQHPPKATPKAPKARKRKADELVEAPIPLVSKPVSLREGGNRVVAVRGAGYGTNPLHL
jgi:hypothetical protein